MAGYSHPPCPSQKIQRSWKGGSGHAEGSGGSKWLQTFHRIWRSQRASWQRERCATKDNNRARQCRLNDHPSLPNFYLYFLPPSSRFFNRVTRTNQFLHLLIEARGEWSLSLGKEDAKVEEEGGGDSSRDLHSELRWKRKSGGNLYQQVSMNDRLEKKRWMIREWKNLIHFIFEWLIFVGRNERSLNNLNLLWREKCVK